MIRITIELIPFGIYPAKHLGSIDIINTGSGTKTKGNYKYRLSRKGSPLSSWKTGEIEGFPRLQKSAYDLLYRVLKAAVGDRN